MPTVKALKKTDIVVETKKAVEENKGKCESKWRFKMKITYKNLFTNICNIITHISDKRDIPWILISWLVKAEPLKWSKFHSYAIFMWWHKKDRVLNYRIIHNVVILF